MSSFNASPAVGALILVPIIIAASAAFIALKASDYSQALARFICKYWHNHSLWSDIEKTCKRKRLKRSKAQSSSQLYADSWCDLESGSSEQETRYDQFIGQDSEGGARLESGKIITLADHRTLWHPSRASRLAWSFTDPISRDQSQLKPPKLVKPLATAQPLKRQPVKDMTFQNHSLRENGAHLQYLTGQSLLKKEDQR